MTCHLRLVRLEERHTPATATWDGGGADALWTTAANWVGDLAPQAGDDLVFPAGAARLTSVNDYPGGDVVRQVDGDRGAAAFWQSVNLNVGVIANVPEGISSELAIPIDGPGNVVKDGSGTLTLSAANTYTGLTRVQFGTLSARANSALGSAAGAPSSGWRATFSSSGRNRTASRSR